MRGFIETRPDWTGPSIPPGGRRRLRARARLISVRLDGVPPAAPVGHAAIDAAWVERAVGRNARGADATIDAIDAAVIIRTTIIGRRRFRTDRGS
ncbi:MAG: hypothetical protein EA423_01170 [Phycisphaerales bacterium]|nr:MAG: hypothetical protein EA423_01170 [Phycisphaerales bacterium]